jgi:hypothetical protein
LAEAPKSRAIALLLELGVVFLGVFIALAADSWSQSQEEAERELAYMRALQSDVIEAQDRIAAAIGETSAYLEETDAFLGLLRSDTPVSDNANQARLNVAALAIPMGTLDALLATGDLNLLSHQELRTTIINERSELGTWLRLIEQFNAEVFANVARYIVAIEELRVEYRVGAAPLPFAAIRGSPQIVGAHEIHRLALRNHLGFMNSISESLAVLGTSVTNALDGRQ